MLQDEERRQRMIAGTSHATSVPMQHQAGGALLMIHLKANLGYASGDAAPTMGVGLNPTYCIMYRFDSVDSFKSVCRL